MTIKRGKEMKEEKRGRVGGIFCVPGEKMEHARCTTEQREFMKYKMKDETKFLSNFTKRKKGEGNTLKHREQLKYRK